MRRLAVALGALGAAAALLPALTRWQRRWGATPDEIARAMPGDDLVVDPRYVTNRAISVHAPPDCIYPWLVQMGYRRGGLYSYDFLDRLFGILDRPSATEVHPEWQDLEVGDLVEVKHGPAFPVATLEPNAAFVLGDPEVGWTWQTCMYPRPDGSTRLVTRNRANWKGSARAGVLAMDLAAFIMVRRWLQVLKQRAEGLHAQRQQATADRYLGSLESRPPEAATLAAQPPPAVRSG